MQAFLDSSAVVALFLGEPAMERVSAALGPVRRAIATPLLEAEVRAVAARERIPADADMFWWLDWIAPTRSLEPEISRVLEAGVLRGADCWHLAVALSITPDPAELLFLTLDERQRHVARTLGFNVEFPT
jgi:predicted nucleic acid-binding protein